MVIPNIYRKENRFNWLTANAQEGGEIRIINGELTEDNILRRQLFFQGVTDVKLGQAGMRKTTIQTYKMQHAFYFFTEFCCETSSFDSVRNTVVSTVSLWESV
jgi:hypothetical protein